MVVQTETTSYAFNLDQNLFVSLSDDSIYTGVGKSCLLLRFSDGSFTTSFITTIGLVHSAFELLYNLSQMIVF